VVYLGGTLFALVQMGAAGFIPFHLLPWFLIYVVLAILMVGGNGVALGAVCNDHRDAQNLTLPSILPVLIPMFILGPMLREPHSLFATVASLIPPFTPVLMLMRQGTPAGVPLWQPLVGACGHAGLHGPGPAGRRADLPGGSADAGQDAQTAGDPALGLARLNLKAAVGIGGIDPDGPSAASPQPVGRRETTDGRR
jgi:hypothetical protein